jgi:hypothetical protein
MKKILVFIIFAALVGSLYGQSVNELARREKARREALKGNRAKVVSNVDLAAVRKTPAVIVVNPDSAEEANASGIGGQDSSGLTSGGAGETSGAVVMVPTVAKNGPVLIGNSDSADQPASTGDAEARLKATNELIDLLSTKMNALMQESNNLNSMTPKDVIQRQIDDTNRKLIRVQEEAARLKDQIEAGKKTAQDKR